MLATAISVLPIGGDWTFEFKWDGVRVLLEARPGAVRLWSRLGNEISAAYPEFAAIGSADVLVDGEVVAFVDSAPSGRPSVAPSFEALASRMHVRDPAEARRLAAQLPVSFLAFDLLRLDGVDLTGRPLAERRDALRRWVDAQPDGSPVAVSPVFDDGAATLQAAQANHLEGVVAKRAGSHYRAGTRSRDWLKLRFTHTGDFVVIGWEAARDSPTTLSSLVLAESVDEGLRYVSKVGSGLSAATADALRRQLRTRDDCPVRPAPPPSPGRVTHWVEPELVVEVEFAVRTADGRLRHPVLHRVRPDKTVEQATG